MKIQAEPKRSAASLRPRRARLQKPMPAVGCSARSLACSEMQTLGKDVGEHITEHSYIE